jgi:hypothetical protein
MSYDNTKLDLAVSAWIKDNCFESKGETYAGDLLADFETYVAQTGALKGSPGRVAFGKALARAGFEKRKHCALTYWLNLLLEKPPEVSIPRSNKKPANTLRVETKIEKELKFAKLAEKKAAERKRQAATVQKRLLQETKQAFQAVGKPKTD